MRRKSKHNLKFPFCLNKNQIGEFLSAGVQSVCLLRHSPCFLSTVSAVGQTVPQCVFVQLPWKKRSLSTWAWEVAGRSSRTPVQQGALMCTRTCTHAGPGASRHSGSHSSSGSSCPPHPLHPLLLALKTSPLLFLSSALFINPLLFATMFILGSGKAGKKKQTLRWAARMFRT